MPTTLYLCAPAWETFLGEELQRAMPSATIRRQAPGWLGCEGVPHAGSYPPIALCQQVMPDAVPLPTPSISKGADALSRRIVECLREHEGPWRLHVFKPTEVESSASRRRCQLITEAVDKQLAKRQRRLRRSRVDDHGAPWQADEWLIQLGLMTAEQGWFCSLPPSQRQRWEATLSRLPGGEIDFTHDRSAPSRAHGKLVEAQLQWGESIEAGQTCVDLGASPGGWTYLAVEQGAEVIAVDRSALREDLMRHSLVTFVEGDAFRFQPTEPVDWLLCDVIAFPDKTLGLLRTWLEARWCRRFCVTIKFRSHEQYALLDDFKQLLAEQTQRFTLRRLKYNKNEVTAIGVTSERSI